MGRHSAIESETPRPRSATRWIALLGGAVVVLLAAEVIALSTVDQNDGSPATAAAVEHRTPSASPTAPSSPSPGTSPTTPTKPPDLVNARAGYSFDYPHSWNVTKQGTVTEVVSPNNKVIVSVGIGPHGSLGAAADRFVSLLQGSYEGLTVGGRSSTSLNGSSSIVVRGTAMNSEGAPIRFLAVVVEGPEDNFAISAFTGSDRASSARTGPVARLIRSFSPTLAG